jgi:hypothetical protein
MPRGSPGASLWDLYDRLLDAIAPGCKVPEILVGLT